MRSEKTDGQDCRIEAGKKSAEENLRVLAERILRTSEEVTGGREESVEPAFGRSGKTRSGERQLSCLIMVDLRLRILEMKKSEKVWQSSRFSLSVRLLSPACAV